MSRNAVSALFANSWPLDRSPHQREVGIRFGRWCVNGACQRRSRARRSPVNCQRLAREGRSCGRCGGCGRRGGAGAAPQDHLVAHELRRCIRPSAPGGGTVAGVGQIGASRSIPRRRRTSAAQVAIGAGLRRRARVQPAVLDEVAPDGHGCRAATSHSASVGRRAPAQVAKASAS